VDHLAPRLTAVATTIFMCAQRNRGAKAIALYGFALPPTAAEIRTIDNTLSFGRPHIEVRDTRVQRCTPASAGMTKTLGISAEACCVCS
jgi:hypothetical protein